MMNFFCQKNSASLLHRSHVMNEGQMRCCYHKMGQPLHLVGKIAKDPRVTYEARIIDHIEIKNNKARFAVEITCETASK